MAAPRELNVTGRCGLEIELTDLFSGADVTDSSLRWEYRITNGIKIKVGTFAGERRLNGWLSPFALVTLSEEELENAGIPKEAKTFAYMYPPQEVAEMFHRNDPNLDITNKKNEREGIISAITRGGFAYFDSDLNCLQLNALSRKSARNKLRFAGPFEVSETTCLELYKMKKQKENMVCRTQTLTLNKFREAGFVSFAWIRPEEKFNFKPAIIKHQNADGAFIFLRENGTGVAYAVDHTDYVVPTGYVGIVSDVFGSFDESTSSQKPMKSIFEVKAWKTKHEYLLNVLDKKNIKKLINTLPDQNSLFHMSCHADLDTDFIAFLLESQGNRNLSHEDTFGWNPLHYACRFSKDSTIKLLVEADPKAVMTPDHYGRYPLHIACDSNTSVDVITTLLEADSSPTKITLTSPTRRMKLLPIHLACYHGNTSDSILKALLDADIDGQTAVTKTVYGQLPLHLAIIKKLPESMVKMLLDADSKLQVTQNRNYGTELDVYCSFEGKLPLHWACWNNSSPKIIELLLEKDEGNTSVYETLSMDHGPSRGNETSVSSIGTHSDLNMRGNDPRQSLLSKDAQVNSVALHLAMKHGCIDVIGLLLQKETDPPNGMSRPIYQQDNIGRTPLHIACEHNVNSQVIRELLKLDSTKKTIQTHDYDGYRPLHYACRNKSTSIETINILCDAEEQRIACAEKVIDEEHIIPNPNSNDQTQKSPLYLAIKAGAKEKIIDRLLQPKKFGFEGFDESAMNKLATMITNSKTIQNKILGILSDRLYFSVLMTEFYANIIALVAFINGSMKLREEDGGKIQPSLLVICTVIFILRELLDMKSIGKAYVRDPWNVYELVCIVFLILTAVHMFQQAQERDKDKIWKEILCVTGFSLVMQLIFFLRATFLPFARFVGGLAMIVKELIPFIVILFLMNLAFAYSYWINSTTRVQNEKARECDPDADQVCTDLGLCILTKFGDLFNFEPQQACTDTTELDILFGFIIIIVLLNVVIAIVSETWRSTENESIQFLWESRLQRIRLLQYALHLRDKLSVIYPQIEQSWLLQFIDNRRDISYQNDISWTKPPYNSVTERAQYENPKEYFEDDLYRKVHAAKSLSSDLYWAEMDARNNGRGPTNGSGQLRSRSKLVYIFKWLGSCLIYAFLIIIGAFTGGIFWPKNFRSGVLSVNS